MNSVRNGMDIEEAFWRISIDGYVNVVFGLRFLL